MCIASSKIPVLLQLCCLSADTGSKRPVFFPPLYCMPVLCASKWVSYPFIYLLQSHFQPFLRWEQQPGQLHCFRPGWGADATAASELELVADEALLLHRAKICQTPVCGTGPIWHSLEYFKGDASPGSICLWYTATIHRHTSQAYTVCLNLKQKQLVGYEFEPAVVSPPGLKDAHHQDSDSLIYTLGCTLT